MSGAEPVGGKPGLGQGECAAASTKSERPVRKGRSERHARKAGDSEGVGAAPCKTDARDTGRFAGETGIWNLGKSR
jgi:hypothetical protein